MIRSREQPPGALVLRTYQELDRFVGAFADGLLNLLLIIGRPGVQKSHAVKAAVGRRACWIDGSATAFGLYCQLYRHRDRPVVIDDVDGLYADRAAVRLLVAKLKADASFSSEAERVRAFIAQQGGCRAPPETRTSSRDSRRRTAQGRPCLRLSGSSRPT